MYPKKDKALQLTAILTSDVTCVPHDLPLPRVFDWLTNQKEKKWVSDFETDPGRICFNYTVDMGNSVTVLAGYQFTELVKIISVSGDLMSSRPRHDVLYTCTCIHVQRPFGNVSTFGMTCLGEPSGKESIHKGVN